jgi:hypothetical protein
MSPPMIADQLLNAGQLRDCRAGRSSFDPATATPAPAIGRNPLPVRVRVTVTVTAWPARLGQIFVAC